MDWRIEPLDFSALSGWETDDQSEAVVAFRRSARRLAEFPSKPRPLGLGADTLAEIAGRALALATLPPSLARGQARDFFQTEFSPVLIQPRNTGAFFTGYYEPEVRGARIPSRQFSVPLYRRPADLIELDEAHRPTGLDASQRFARAVGEGIEPYRDRAAIEAGFLQGRGLELVWLESPIDAFFIHIQGSARVRLPDGDILRLGYDGKNGHPYTPIGRVLVEAGELQKGAVTMAAIRSWLAGNPERAAHVMRQNRSFIFFRQIGVEDQDLGPVGGGAVQLTAGRSLAVDRELHAFHMPVWVETIVPGPDGPRPFHRLLIAQDTGSAIVGPARGDIFFGSGEVAASLAGSMQAGGRFVLLIPRGSR